MRYKININENCRMIFYITAIIISILIIMPLIFFDYDSKAINFFEIKDNNVVSDQEKITFPRSAKVKVYDEKNDKVEEVDLEDYVAGVVCSEMPANFNEEALKAQAVAARTYYMNKRNDPCDKAKEKGAEICNTTHCQVYLNKEERLKTWSSKDGESNWNKIKTAVDETQGQVLTYEKELLKYPQFFAVSSGHTEDAQDVFSFDVPYLKSTESEGEEIAPKYKSRISLTIDEFISKFNGLYKKSNLTKKNIGKNINIISYTKAGSVKEIEAGGVKITGKQFRSLFNLNSANFKISISGNTVIIDCVGYGHGVGMSQWGANAMAKNGSKYDEILKHYYTGVEIENIEYK